MICTVRNIRPSQQSQLATRIGKLVNVNSCFKSMLSKLTDFLIHIYVA